MRWNVPIASRDSWKRSPSSIRIVFVLSSALIVALGCGSETEPTPSTAQPVSERGAPERSRPTEVEMVRSMEAHYGAAILAHDALLQGDLQAFGTQLRLLTDQQLPDASPDAWQPLHEELLTASRAGVRVEDLDGAAVALANVALACGRCHAALDSGPVYPAPAPPDGDSPLATAMLDHQWATERLWEGVTGPWDNAWQRGADALVTTEVFGAEDSAADLSADLQAREDALRAIGLEARDTAALDERAALYGQLLTTCGECHRAIGATFDEPS